MPEALVVGGSSAIGAAIGVALAGLGHDVVLWGRDAERLERSRVAIAAGGGRARSRIVDVTRDDDVLEAAEDLSGAEPLRAVVWAAGVFDWGPASDADPRAWRRLLDVNLTAAATATAVLLPRLVAGAPSALVYVGSGAARQAYPSNAAYVASKHGLRGLAEGVWLDVREHDVKVSTVSPRLVAAGAGLQAPGATDHPERLLRPEDVAAAVTFVVTFPGRGCPTEIRVEPQHPL